METTIDRKEWITMKFECPQCNKQYEVPEDKLPPKKKVSFPCLNCKERIALDLEALRNIDAAGAEANPPSPETGAADEPQAETNGDFRKKILRQLKDLPPMPQIVFKARHLLANPDSEMRDLSALLESDQAIATKVLKLANSAYYGLCGKVSSIRHASSMLGFKALGQLISMVGTSAVLGKTLQGYDLDSAGTWRHSLMAASASRIIALGKNPALESDAFSAGLIHDVGKLVLDRHVDKRKSDFERLTEGGRNSMLVAEQRILGLDHAEIGFEVCQYWNIPETISTAIKFHHQPSKSEDDELAYIIFMANSIANMAKALEDSESMIAQMDGIEAHMYMIDDEALAFLALTEEDVPRILGEARKAVDSLSEEMQIVAA
ncbi:MAG: HDOD domain-containing protein [Desulfobacterales bacterium]|nr:HDOD domain-containing protein [Desulfobacterales bacterium]